MNAPKSPRISSLVLAAGATLVLACGGAGGDEEAHPRTQSASRIHDDREDPPRAVVDLAPDPDDGPTRRGVEPSAAHGAVGNHPAGQALAEDRTAFIADTRNRLVELDQEIERLRVESLRRGDPFPERIVEQRQVIARQFDALLRAPEEDWKDLRNQLAERLDEVAFSVDQTRARAAGEPSPRP